MKILALVFTLIWVVHFPSSAEETARMAQVTGSPSGLLFKRPKDCSATTVSNCDLPLSLSGSNVGSCVSGYSGSCSYKCFRGDWSQNSSSCLADCNLPWGGSIASGNSVPAYSSAAPVGVNCSTVSETRTCTSGSLSGSLTIENCASGCAAGTTSSCNYNADADGSSSGSCPVGYTGSCAYSCNDGTRNVVSNTCAPPVCGGNGLTFINSESNSSGPYDVYWDGTYIYATDRSALRAFSFNGTTFTQESSASTSSGQEWMVHGSGSYIYDMGTSGLAAHTFNGSSFTEHDSISENLSNDAGVWSRGNEVFAIDEYQDQVVAYTFNGSTLTERDRYDLPGYTTVLHGDSNYIYVRSSGDHMALTFDGTTLALAAQQTISGTSNGAIYSDGDYVYLSHSSGIGAYTFNGTTFTHIASTPGSFSVVDIWSTGASSDRYILGVNSSNLRAWKFSGSEFTEMATATLPSNGSALTSDGEYIYVSSWVGKVSAFAFDCDGFGSPDTQNPAWQTAAGTISTIKVGVNIGLQNVAVNALDNSGYLSYAKQGGTGAWLEVDSTTGAITGTAPLTPGAYTITIRAEDPSGNYSDRTFTVDVQDDTNQPTWVTPGGTIATMQTSSAIVASAYATDDSGEVIYSKVSGDSWLSVDSSTGALSGTSPSTPGIYSITVKASDPKGNNINRVFNVEVESYSGGSLSCGGTGLAYISSESVSSGPYDVYWDGSYIYATDRSLLRAFSFDGANFTQAGSSSTAAGQEWMVHGYGSYIFDMGTSGLAAHTFNGSSFTQPDSVSGNFSNDAGVWSRTGQVFVIDEYEDELVAYTFNGSSLTERDRYTFPSYVNDLHGDDDYIYVKSGSQIFALTFDGTTLGLVAQQTISAVSSGAIYSDGTYIYMRHSNAIGAYVLNGATFELRATSSSISSVTDIWSNGDFVMATGSSDTKAWRFDGYAFHDMGSISTSSSSAITSDGNYIFLGSWVGKVSAYAFDCTGFGAPDTQSPSWQTPAGTISTIKVGVNIGLKSVFVGAIDNSGTESYSKQGGTGTWLDVNATTGAITGTAPMTPGSYTITVRATDPSTNFSDRTFTVEVQDDTNPPTWITPSGTIATMQTSATIVASAAATDDSTEVTYSKVSGDSWLSVDSSTGAFSGTSPATPGTYTMTVKASDPKGNNVDRTFNVEVESYAGGSLSCGGAGFAFINTETDTSGPYDLFWDGSYLYATDRSNLRAFTFDGANFTQVGSSSTSAGQEWMVHGSSGYVYDMGTSGLAAHTFNGTSFTEPDSISGNLSNEAGVWSRADQVFVIDEYEDELIAYTFDGSSFTERARYSLPGYTTDLHGDSNYIYVNSGIDLLALTFDGTNFELAAQQSVPAASGGAIYSDGTYIYVKHSSEIGAYSLNGATFELRATSSSIGSVTDIWSNGDFVMATSSSTTKAWRFDGYAFHDMGSTTSAPSGSAITSDGTHVFVGSWVGNTTALSFDCTGW